MKKLETVISVCKERDASKKEEVEKATRTSKEKQAKHSPEITKNQSLEASNL